MEPKSYFLFIGGTWTEASDGRRFPVINPATEEVVATVPNAGVAEMQAAIEAAVAAQRSWAETTAQERARILSAAAARMRERADELGRILTMEEGKPLSEGRAEIAYAASFLEWFAGEAQRIYGDIIPASTNNKRLFVLKRPVGVTAAITPWNFPAAMITRKLGPALAAGCTMIVKPSELTPLTALEIAKIFEEVGLPRGVLSVVVGDDAPLLAKVLMDDFRVRKVSFTGSTEVGKILMRQAADTVKRVSLELGGHAPLIVFDDADLDAAVAEAVTCKMRGMGETCVSANRIFVQRNVAEAFASKMAEAMGSMKIGNGLEDGVQVGPLIEPAALAKVERHVADAVQKGARVLVGGERLEGTTGYFYRPTVLMDVNEDMLVMQEETFGPVAAIAVFDTEDEVVERANNTRYGLAAYFFTRDVGRVFRLADRLEYGILGANDGLPSTAQAPFGGVKESGIGREGSKYGIDEYLDVKFLSLGGIKG
jgi:succinate-semialdehyde dehydrogenase/glutarate-semialdehyde dehydrogenase